MKTINERIVYLIDTDCSGNKSAFARQIGITPAYAAQIYKMERVPSDRTISDICRVFNVNPEWLRNGVEPMLMPATDEEAEYITELLMGTDDPVVDVMKSILKVYMALSDQDKKKVREFVSKTKESRD